MLQITIHVIESVAVFILAARIALSRANMAIACCDDGSLLKLVALRHLHRSLDVVTSVDAILAMSTDSVRLRNSRLPAFAAASLEWVVPWWLDLLEALAQID